MKDWFGGGWNWEAEKPKVDGVERMNEWREEEEGWGGKKVNPSSRHSKYEECGSESSRENETK